MIALTRRRPSFAVLALLAVLATILLTAGSQDAWSAPYRLCKLSEKDQSPAGGKPTFNLTLGRKGVSCATAKSVAKAFHKCRPAARYGCAHKVLAHWSCTGKKVSSGKRAIYAKFTCGWGDRRVTSMYQLNTR